jgi:phosphoglycerate dehydrogenase-like enzyme
VFERSRLRPLPLVLITPKAAAASSRRERLSARDVFERSRLRPLPLVLITPKAAAASSRRERLSARDSLRSGATNIPKAAANAAAFVVLSARGVFERSRLRPLPLVLVTPKAAAASSRRERLSARSGANHTKGGCRKQSPLKFAV